MSRLNVQISLSYRLSIFRITVLIYLIPLSQNVIKPDHVHKRAEQKNGNKSPCSLECLQTTHTAQKNTYKCWATNTAALTRLISSSGFDTSSSKLFKALIRPYSQKVCQPHKTLLLGQETLGITKWSHHKQKHPQVHAPPCNYFEGSHSFLITK